MEATALPTTLQEAVIYFADLDRCVEYLASRRWPNGVACPTCGDTHVRFDRKRRVWTCNSKHPKRQFSVKVGTIFEDSPIGLDKWLPAVWMIGGAKNGISSYELHRALGVTQKTAWFMLHRIRLAMQDGDTGGQLDGGVEIDETFIGGKARNMSKAKKDRVLEGRRGGLSGKLAVMGLLQRHPGKGQSKVRLRVVGKNRRVDVLPHVVANVAPGANVFTDALPSYDTLYQHGFMHEMIDHAERYVNGNIHTNGMENFWALLKRTLGGTYISVEPFHLFRYLDEQAFRFNGRAGTDADRFADAIGGILGRRLTFAALTGGERP